MNKFATFALPFLFLMILSCDSNDCIRGEGQKVTETLALETISSITLFGSEKVTITQGNEQLVSVTGHKNIIDELNRKVDDEHWEIRLKDGCYKNADLAIEIQLSQLHAAYLNGSGDISIGDFEGPETQEFILTGSGNLSLLNNSGTNELLFVITGSGAIDCNGTFNDLTELDLTISGSGDIQAFKAPADQVFCQLTGSGNARVTANNELDVKIAGSGNVYYKGDPGITSTISGSGKLINDN